MKNQLNKCKIFIAGHNGMVGSALVHFLQSQEVEIITKNKFNVKYLYKFTRVYPTKELEYLLFFL